MNVQHSLLCVQGLNFLIQMSDRTCEQHEEEGRGNPVTAALEPSGAEPLSGKTQSTEFSGRITIYSYVCCSISQTQKKVLFSGTLNFQLQVFVHEEY